MVFKYIQATREWDGENEMLFSLVIDFADYK